MKYKRILLKVSGGALSGDKDFGFDKASLEATIESLKEQLINA